MKRCLAMLLLCCLMVGALVLPASADSYASKVDSYVTVSADGDALVALTATLHLESPDETLTFPLPLEATGISMNGGSARTTKTATDHSPIGTSPLKSFVPAKIMIASIESPSSALAFFAWPRIPVH